MRSERIGLELTGSRRARYYALSVVAAAGALIELDLTAIHVAIPQLRRTLDATFVEVQWVIDAYALSLASFVLVTGSLSDLWGRRRVFLAGLAVFVAASAACGLAPNIGVLNCFRAIQGLGGATILSVGPALLGEHFHGRERGMAFGVFGAVSGLALAAGPVIGGFLIGALGWRSIFLVNLPIGAVTALLTLRHVRRSPGRPTTRVDWWGALVLFGATALLLLTVLRWGELASSQWRTAVSLTGSLALFAVFLAHQWRRRESPLFDVSMLRNVTFNGISIATFLAAATSVPVVFFVVSYLQNVLGQTPLEAGLTVLPWTLLICIASFVSGRLSVRVPPRISLGVAFLLLATGIACGTLVTDDSGWTSLLPLMIFSGLGLGIWNPPRIAVAIGTVPPDRGGMASGYNMTFHQLGVAVGVAVLGAVFQRAVRTDLESGELGEVVRPRAAEIAGHVAAGELDTGALGVGGMETIGNAATRSAFLAGFHTSLWLAAGGALAGAIAAFGLLRRRDLHPSARPGDRVTPSVP